MLQKMNLQNVFKCRKTKQFTSIEAMLKNTINVNKLF